jgi:hypothetical protein
MTKGLEKDNPAFVNGKNSHAGDQSVRSNSRSDDQVIGNLAPSASAI